MSQSLYTQFLNMRNDIMFISLYIFLFHICGVDSDTFPYLKDKKENIKNMLNYAIKIKSRNEVKNFLNSEAIESLWIKAKL